MKPDVPIEKRANIPLNKACEWAGVGYRRASKLIKTGEWRAFPCGREIRVIPASILEWQERQAEAYRQRSA